MWIISLHVSSPGIWHMDHNDGMEQGSHQKYVIREKLPWAGECVHLIRRVLHCLNHIPGMVSDLRKTEAINTLQPILKIETRLKQKNPQGKSIDRCWHQFVSSSICLSPPCCLWVCRAGGLRWDFQGKKMKEGRILFWEKLSRHWWLKQPIDIS